VDGIPEVVDGVEVLLAPELWLEVLGWAGRAAPFLETGGAALDRGDGKVEVGDRLGVEVTRASLCLLIKA
jgi:hypothetical protein